MPTTSDAPAPRLRRDAARNRALLIATADQLVSHRGLDISFHDLADAAGVGVGTVYRHFADKHELLGALVEARFATARDILLDAESIDDPIEALIHAIIETCTMQQSDRGIWQAMLSDAALHRELAREHLLPVSERIVARAKASGRLRQDFEVTDLPVFFILGGSLSLAVDGVRPQIWRRYVGAMLDGFLLREQDRLGATTGAPSEDEFHGLASGAVPQWLRSRAGSPAGGTRQAD